MKTVYLVMIGSHGMELDRIEMLVKDPDDCAREVLATMTRARWVLGVGDRVEVQE